MPLMNSWKKKRTAGFLLALFFALLPAASARIGQEEAAIFEKANEAYRAGDFAGAAELYQGLTKASPQSAVFYYNLGNALYRQGKTGAAILAYEKAHVRDPRQQDIRANLKFVRGSLPYVIEDKRNWYIKAGESLLSNFREQEVNILFVFVQALFLSAWLYGRYRKTGQPWGTGRKTLLALTVLFGLFTAAKTVQTHIIRHAIVVAQEAEVRYGPSVEDQVALRLGEGLKVYVIDARKTWSRVWLVNGESGWIKKSQIEEV